MLHSPKGKEKERKKISFLHSKHFQIETFGMNTKITGILVLSYIQLLKVLNKKMYVA